MQTSHIIIIIATIFLVPLIPAFLIGKYLPSETLVTGPFRGLNLRLAGAFGGYFILLLVAVPIGVTLYNDSKVYEDLEEELASLKEEIAHARVWSEAWRLSGDVKVEADGELRTENLRILLQPPRPHKRRLESNVVTFDVNVPMLRHANSSLEPAFESVILQYSDSYPLIRDLPRLVAGQGEDDFWRIDEGARVIKAREQFTINEHMFPHPDDKPVMKELREVNNEDRK